MESMRATWTDERLDDLIHHVDGGFERVDKERGQAIISATRMPNTPGVSGTGTLVGIIVRGVAPGNSQLSIVQVNAKDSQQRPIQMVTSEAAIRVQ